MKVREAKDFLDGFDDDAEVITLKDAQKYFGADSLVLEKFGIEMQDKTPSVLGGILKLGLLVVRYPEPNFQVEDSEVAKVAGKK